MQCFNRMKTHVLRAAGLGLCLFGGSAFSADTTNYDTAWTYQYDGGVARGKDTIADGFRDGVLLSNGDALFVGVTRDSTYFESILAVKVSSEGKLVQKKALRFSEGTMGATVLVDKNGDYLVGGEKIGAPFLVRLDPAFNVKSEFWYYDTIQHRNMLNKNATLQGLVRKRDGRIAATGGDFYPDRENNYAFWMEFDSVGTFSRVREWGENSTYPLSGWSILETSQGEFLMGGQQTVVYLDTAGVRMGMKKYTFSLPGVGTETNNITRVRKLRDGRFLAVGQAYEEDCWTRYQRLYFDGWWSLLSTTGQNLAWNTAGVSGTDDNLFDAVQLADGRIAFAGNKTTSPDSGLWVFVTDSAGTTIEWEKQFNLPGKVGSRTRNDISTYALIATPDSGFIVAGTENRPGNYNDAVAFKFIWKPIPTALRPGSAKGIRQSWISGRRFIRFEASAGAEVELRILNVRGQELARYSQRTSVAGQGEFDLGDLSLRRGLYVWEFKVNHAVTRGSWAIME